MPLIANNHQFAGFRLNKTAGPVLLIVLIGTAAVTSAHFISAALAKKVPKAAAVAQSIQPPNMLETQRITLTPMGFEPAEVTRPAGRFLLAINDRSGQGDSRFVLRRSTGEQLREFRVAGTPRKHEWREVVNLPPGRYLLSDGDNPEHVCHLLLTN
jgi:uncharacterized cupredoxin-like copper-binding protein